MPIDGELLSDGDGLSAAEQVSVLRAPITKRQARARRFRVASDGVRALETEAEGQGRAIRPSGRSLFQDSMPREGAGVSSDARDVTGGAVGAGPRNPVSVCFLPPYVCFCLRLPYHVVVGFYRFTVFPTGADVIGKAGS